MDLLGRVTCDHVVGTPEIKYSIEACPRCKGTGVYGDVEFDVTGDLKYVELGNELVQDILKTLTEHMRNTGYGFNYKLFGDTIRPDTVSDIKAEVIRCMQYLKDLQDTSLKEGKFYKASELLERIDNLIVRVDTTEPRKIFITFDALAVSSRRLNVDLNLEL